MLYLYVYMYRHVYSHTSLFFSTLHEKRRGDVYTIILQNLEKFGVWIKRPADGNTAMFILTECLYVAREVQTRAKKKKHSDNHFSLSQSRATCLWVTCKEGSAYLDGSQQPGRDSSKYNLRMHELTIHISLISLTFHDNNVEYICTVLVCV